MKIRFIKTDELFGATFNPGQEIEVVDEIGKAKIKKKTAIQIDAEIEEVQETAEVLDPEEVENSTELSEDVDG